MFKARSDDYYNTRKNSIEIKRGRQLDAIRSIKDKQKKMKPRGKMKNYDDRIGDYEPNLKIKMITDFGNSVACSIKSLAGQKN